MNTVVRLRRWARLTLLLPMLCMAAPALAQTVATLTFADGKVGLLRGTATFTVAAGVKIEAGDMIDTGAKSQAQLEFGDGLILNLGAESRLYLLPAGTGASADFALAAGWMKAAIAAGHKLDSHPSRYILPGLTVETAEATVVLHAAPGFDEFFVESGTVKTTEIAHDGSFGKSFAAKGGDYVSRKDGQAATPGRAPQTFLGGMPAHFRDNLPSMIAKVKTAREPARDHDTTYAEAQAWLNANALVRPALAARYQTRAKDAEFRAGLVADMSMHPEWERSLGGAKPAKKK
jgi:hypothetical protein